AEMRLAHPQRMGSVKAVLLMYYPYCTI
ncbi:hypothetical protein Q604_UNBC06544G0001, partial [human gut metagenome]